MLEWVKDVMVPIITAMIGAGGWKWFSSWRENNKGKKIEHTFERIADIYELLHELKDEIDADRVNIIMYHNGGGIPKTGSPSYKSILYEAHRDGLEAIRHELKGYQLDEEYSKQLNEVILHGYFYMPDNNRLPKSVARGINDRLGITSCYKIKIISTDKAIYTLSATFSQANLVTPRMEAAIRLKVNQLKQIIE